MRNHRDFADATLIDSFAGQGDTGGPNGSFTWVTANATRALCAAITSQLGHSWPMWVVIASDGQDIALTMSEQTVNSEPVGRGTRHVQRNALQM